MDELTKSINDEIAEISRQWAAKFLAGRRSTLNRRKIKASGSLIDSLESEVGIDEVEQAVRILIAFNEEGRIAEMRRIHHDKWGRNAMTRLENWVQDKGLQNFAPGFLARRRLKTAPKDIINQIAWGIMVTRAGGKFRRKPWWAKAKTAGVTDLYNQAAVASLDKSAEGLVDLLKQARIQGRR